MPPPISVSTNQQDHLAAAKALSKYLDDMKIPHAYIGGFAWSLLGSVRPTEIKSLYDIDVLVEDGNLLELRKKIMEADERFADVGVKLYYVTQNHDSELVREERVRGSRNNVLVETLPAGQLGLPGAIVATFKPGEPGVSILHPAILVLTKFKRWSINCSSTRPQTMRKTTSDQRDIAFIIEWLAEHSESIRFDDYPGKTKVELLAMIRKYHDKFVENVEHMECLQSIMSDEEWRAMLDLPEPELEDSNIPP